jgi:hypothetical protein
MARSKGCYLEEGDEDGTAEGTGRQALAVESGSRLYARPYVEGFCLTGSNRLTAWLNEPTNWC